MVPVSLRLKVLLATVAVLGWPAAARANHHHIGGSGSGGDDPNADCLVWGYVVVDGGAVDAGAAVDGSGADATDADAAISGGGGAADAAQPADAATSDAGSAPPAGAVLVCLEHASLFGCDCSVGPRATDQRCGVGLVVAMLLIARRRRRTRPAGGAR
jgi:MYXO-CTERM domain-containing protein